VPYGTGDLLAGSDGFDDLYNPHKICPPQTHPVRWIVPGALKGKWSRFNPGLKSGVTKSVMPDGIFFVNDKDKFEYGFHLIVIYTKINDL